MKGHVCACKIKHTTGLTSSLSHAYPFFWETGSIVFQNNIMNIVIDRQNLEN